MLPPLLALVQSLGAVYLLTEAARACVDRHAESKSHLAAAALERARVVERGGCIRTAVEAETRREIARVDARLRRDLRAIDLLDGDIRTRSAARDAWIDSIRQLNARLADPELPAHELMATMEVIMTCHARLAGETRTMSGMIREHVATILREMNDDLRRPPAPALPAGWL